MEVRDTDSIVKKSNSENNTKRTRNDGASSTLPPFKVLYSYYLYMVGMLFN